MNLLTKTPVNTSKKVSTDARMENGEAEVAHHVIQSLKGEGGLKVTNTEEMIIETKGSIKDTTTMVSFKVADIRQA